LPQQWHWLRPLTEEPGRLGCKPLQSLQSFLISSGRIGAQRIIYIYVNKNVLPIEPDWKLSQASILRIYATSGADVKFPVMPGAAKSFVRQVAFTQTAVLVGTGIRECIYAIIEVNQQNGLSVHLDASHFTAPEIL
jgi:hypothetical protein